MIHIKKSKTADTRSCDFSNVTKDILLESSYQHINDVDRGIGHLIWLLDKAALVHDFDKITRIDHFHSDFITGFKETGWYKNHVVINRHHLKECVPEGVTLIDVLEMIVDCVMAGMGRTGSVYPLEISDELLKTAFNNTVDLIKNQVIVEE